MHDAMVEQPVQEILVESLAQRLAAPEGMGDDGETGNYVGDLKNEMSEFDHNVGMEKNVQSWD